MAEQSRGSTETRQRILDAALDAFTRHGYHSTTMDAIAAQSGTSKGTLYWYFDSKEDLLETAIRELFEGAFSENNLVELTVCPSASEKLRVLSTKMVAFIQEVDGLFNLFLEFWASSSHREEAADLWMDLLLQYKDIVTQIIEDGIRSGEFRIVDAESLAWAYLSTYDALAAYRMLRPEMALPQISATYLETLLRGLKAEP